MRRGRAEAHRRRQGRPGPDPRPRARRGRRPGRHERQSHGPERARAGGALGDDPRRCGPATSWPCAGIGGRRRATAGRTRRMGRSCGAGHAAVLTDHSGRPVCDGDCAARKPSLEYVRTTWLRTSRKFSPCLRHRLRILTWRRLCRAAAGAVPPAGARLAGLGARARAGALRIREQPCVLLGPFYRLGVYALPWFDIVFECLVLVCFRFDGNDELSYIAWTLCAVVCLWHLSEQHKTKRKYIG